MLEKGLFQRSFLTSGNRIAQASSLCAASSQLGDIQIFSKQLPLLVINTPLVRPHSRPQRQLNLASRAVLEEEIHHPILPPKASCRSFTSGAGPLLFGMTVVKSIPNQSKCRNWAWTVSAQSQWTRKPRAWRTISRKKRK